MPSKYDLEYNRQPICPHCGKDKANAWELELDGDGDTVTTECGTCEEEYHITMHVTVEYSTN